MGIEFEIREGESEENIAVCGVDIYCGWGSDGGEGEENWN